MPRRNEFTEALEDITAELRSLRHSADKANPIPFGMERLSKRQYTADRLRKGTADERAEFLAKNGPAAMLKLIRGNNATS